MSEPQAREQRSTPPERQAHPAGKAISARHLWAVPDDHPGPRAYRRRRGLVGGLGVVLVSAGLLGLVAFHVVLTQGQFQLDRLEARAVREQAAYERLRLEVAQLEAPQRVVAEARTRLHMVTPATVKYLSPAPDRRAGPAGPAGTPPNDDGRSWAAVKARLAAGP